MFYGNYDRNTIVTRNLNEQPKAKLVRLVPVTYHRWPTVRLEIYHSKGTIVVDSVIARYIHRDLHDTVILLYSYFKKVVSRSGRWSVCQRPFKFLFKSKTKQNFLAY